MTPYDKEIQMLRADLEWALKSETVRLLFKKDSHGRHVFDSTTIDRTMINMKKSIKELEEKRMAAEAECVRLRRKIEAILTEMEEKHETHHKNADAQA